MVVLAFDTKKRSNETLMATAKRRRWWL